MIQVIKKNNKEEKKKKNKIKLLIGETSSKNFQLNDNLMSLAKNRASFMHCLPANRYIEVTDSVIDGKQSVVWQQAQNRMYIQQSILNFCIS